jgi:hypothetical protein
MANWNVEKVRKSQAAHGVSVTEIAWQGDRWQPVRPFAIRAALHRHDALRVGGPAAGHALMKTAADPAGRQVLGTFNNCASSLTPWGTYLSRRRELRLLLHAGEQPTPHERRWGLRKRVGYRWHEHDARFDAVQHPNEPNRFGWVVEIDPVRSPERAGQAHRARPRRARRRLGRGDARSPRRRLLGRGRALRVHLQVRQPRRDPPGRRGAMQRCSTTARSTSPASTPTAAAAGCRWSHGSGRSPASPTRARS